MVAVEAEQRVLLPGFLKGRGPWIVFEWREVVVGVLGKRLLLLLLQVGPAVHHVAMLHVAGAIDGYLSARIALHQPAGFRLVELRLQGRLLSCLAQAVSEERLLALLVVRGARLRLFSGQALPVDRREKLCRVSVCAQQLRLHVFLREPLAVIQISGVELPGKRQIRQLGMVVGVGTSLLGGLAEPRRLLGACLGQIAAALAVISAIPEHAFVVLR